MEDEGRNAAAEQQARERKKRRRIDLAAMQAAAINNDDALLHLATVEATVGLSSTTIYDRVRDRRFPAPIRLSARCSRWRAGAVRKWLAEQSAASK